MKNFEIRVFSIPMSAEEEKKWKKPEDICPVCKLQFGSKKQVKVGKIFKSAGLPNRTIIHKKCAQR